MKNQVAAPPIHHMIWIYPDNPSRKLDAATALETVRGLGQIGWQVDLLVSGLDGPGEIRGVKVAGISHPKIFLIKHFVYHMKALKYISDNWKVVDVVLFHAISTPWVLLLRLAGSFRRGPRPLFVMDSRTLQMEKKALKDKFRTLYMPVMNVLANWFADGQTAITQRMAETLRIPVKKLWGTWPSGVDKDLFSRPEGTRVWPEGDEPIRIVYIGTLAPGRDLLPLCQAVEIANQENMHFELVLVGDGEDYENLAAFAGHTNGMVKLLGRLPSDQIPATLATMHVGALPFPDRKEFRVSSPIKLFEYMAAGMPILATQISCHTDVMDNSPCAFWAVDSSVESLTAALRHLWINRSSLAARGSMAATLAKEYTWTASARKLANALDHGLALAKRNDV